MRRALTKVSVALGFGTVACAVALMTTGSADARPQYLMKGFSVLYPDNAAAKEAKCNTCHGKNDQGKDDKKVRNVYGQALMDILAEKNVKDEEVIKGALKKAEEKASKIEGKTFGDLIKEGKLPGSES